MSRPTQEATSGSSLHDGSFRDSRADQGAQLLRDDTFTAAA
ncbi:hypothetical protein QWZ10_13285 [Paracoccus cavernae]|uniref:Uncharacterized protein n=1 Tax=Paracoccus cavernae TaxID=1571207 RepID=A0ABT8DAK5_9RHOB|nr:hypothetical protein [Paracoccus cavernae]